MPRHSRRRTSRQTSSHWRKPSPRYQRAHCSLPSSARNTSISSSLTAAKSPLRVLLLVEAEDVRKGIEHHAAPVDECVLRLHVLAEGDIDAHRSAAECKLAESAVPRIEVKTGLEDAISAALFTRQVPPRLEVLMSQQAATSESERSARRASQEHTPSQSRSPLSICRFGESCDQNP